MRISFKTFGCKANSLDTDSLFREAVLRGHTIVPDSEPADAYVINSCTVTANADRDARLSALRFKRQNPTGLVGVVGCYGQVGKDELLAIDEIDVVIGTANKHRVFELFESAERVARDQVEKAAGYLPTEFPGSRNSRANVKIQDGCNFKCSFCIIPEARGRSRSLDLANVEKQVDEAYSSGFQEVVLTGIHLAHYGWDKGTDLEKLLARLIRKPEGPRIRLSTLDPFEIPDSLVQLVTEHPRLCPHFHIALQSGSDEVLKGMRRIYKAQEFVTVTQKIGRLGPRAFVGVDIIVGFPGETEEAFQETVRCLEDSYWTKLHVFPFSARKGTRAEVLPGKVPQREIAKRAEILRRKSDERFFAFLDAQIGSLHQVILEKPSAKSQSLWQGHTANYCATLSEAGKATAKESVLSLVTGRIGDRLLTRPL